MRRWTQLTLAMVAAASFTTGCAGDDAREARNQDSPSAVGTAGTDANRIDQDFVRDQLEDGEAEVMLGRLAAENARNPQVKEFGQMMVREHQKAGDELRQIAGTQTTGTAGERPQPGESPNLARERDNKHQDLHERLSKLSGAEFDREYMDAMVKAHAEAVSELEDQAEKADHPRIKQWASKTLENVQHHLERAKQIQQTLER